MPDILVIGGGHNALVAAFYLAKAGRKPVVLERRPLVGGCAVTEEFAPGYKAPALAHSLGPLRPSIVRDMQLERRGVQFVRPGSAACLARRRTAARWCSRRTCNGPPKRSAPFSAADAGKYPDVLRDD